MADSRNPRGGHADARAAGRRVDVDQNFRTADAVDIAQYAFCIMFDCRRDVWIIRRKPQLNFNVAVIDLDRLHEAE